MPVSNSERVLEESLNTCFQFCKKLEDEKFPIETRKVNEAYYQGMLDAIDKIGDCRRDYDNKHHVRLYSNPKDWDDIEELD